MKLARFTLLIAVTLLASCSKSDPNAVDQAEWDKSDEAMKTSTAIVAKLNESIDIGYEISPGAWGEKPVVVVAVPDPESDYKSTLQTVIDGLGSVSQEIVISYEHPVAVSDDEAASGMKDSKKQLLTHSVKP